MVEHLVQRPGQRRCAHVLSDEIKWSVCSGGGGGGGGVAGDLLSSNTNGSMASAKKTPSFIIAST